MSETPTRHRRAPDAGRAPVTTITAAFAATVRARPDVVALRAGAGDDAATLTWDRYADRACRVAAGLRSAGLRPGERVVLMLRNRPEFHVADMGVQLAGGTPVSVYNSSPPDRIAYVVDHADARLAIVEDAFAERVAAARPSLPGLDTVVCVGDAGDVAFDDLLGAAPLDLDRAAARAAPGDLLTIIYP